MEHPPLAGHRLGLHLYVQGYLLGKHKVPYKVSNHEILGAST